MSKHHSADEKLVSRNVRKNYSNKSLQHPKDYTAPQAPKVGTTQKNQYR